MKNKFNLIIAIILLLVLCGCGNKNENNENTEPYDDTEVYSFVCSWESYNKDDGIDIKYSLENTGTQMELGLIVFVNGVPQKTMNEEVDSYIASKCIEKNQKEQFRIEYTNNSNQKDDIGYIRTVRILEPNKSDITEINNKTAFYRNLSGNYFKPKKVANQYNEEIDVANCKERTIKKSQVNGSCLKMTINGETPKRICNYDEFVGELNIEVSSEIKENYILSFWGDNEPIKIGEHQFYSLEFLGEETRNYIFNITLTDISKYKSFQAILCPCDGNNMVGIETTNSIFFNNDIKDETASTTVEETVSTSAPSDETDFLGMNYLYNDCFIALLSNNSGKKIVKYNVETDEIVSSIELSKLDNNGYFNTMDLENAYLGEGLLIDGDNFIQIFDNNLNPIYEGRKTGFFTLYSIFDYLYISDDSCIGVENISDKQRRVVIKNLKDGSEKEIFNENGVIPINGCVSGTKAIIECYDINNRDKTFVYICNLLTGEKEILQNMSIMFLTPDKNNVLLREYIAGWNADKPYVVVYNLSTNDKKTISFNPDNYTLSNIIATNNGEYLIYRIDGKLNIYNQENNYCQIYEENYYFNYYYPTNKGLVVKYYNDESDTLTKFYSWGEINEKISDM